MELVYLLQVDHVDDAVRDAFQLRLPMCLPDAVAPSAQQLLLLLLLRCRRMRLPLAASALLPSIFRMAELHPKTKNTCSTSTIQHMGHSNVCMVSCTEIRTRRKLYKAGHMDQVTFP